MNLSWWELEPFQTEWDFVIVGAGFAGSWCAYEILKRFPICKLVILDRDCRPFGASIRNAGFACMGSPSEMLSDFERIGEADTLKNAAMRLRGIRKIVDVLGHESVGYEPCFGYELLTQELPFFDSVKANISALNSKLVRALGEDEVFSDATHEIASQGMKKFDLMVKNRLDGAIHSGRALSKLHQLIQGMGARILLNAEAQEVEKDRVSLKNGQSIRGGIVLLCTNAFGPLIVPELQIEPARGQVVVTKPIAGLQLNGTFHMDEGFVYWRHLPGGRVLLGGGRNQAFDEERTTAMEISDRIQNWLEEFLMRHFVQGEAFEIEHRWAGMMGFTPSKTIELTEVSGGVLSVAGCNGMGVALLPIVGELVAEKLC